MDVIRFSWKQRNKSLWCNTLRELVGWRHYAYFPKEQKVFMENQMHTAFHENWKISARGPVCIQAVPL